MRAALFWGLCIPVRILIALYAAHGDRVLLRVLAAIVGTRWLAGAESALIGMFGGHAWWREERTGHGLLWAAYAITGDARALGLDVGMGAANWLSESH